MNYKKLVVPFLPVYLVVSILITIFTLTERLSKVLCGTLGAIGAGLAGILLLYYFGSKKNRHGDEIRNTKHNIIMLAILLPFVACGILVFVFTFIDTIHMRYCEWVSIFVNYSAPFVCTLVFALR